MRFTAATAPGGAAIHRAAAARSTLTDGHGGRGPERTRHRPGTPPVGRTPRPAPRGPPPGGPASHQAT
ncbi:hypothetical protein BJP39_28570 [Streptomyces sp. CC77]|nr:hypothetical protein BJP39_28570 [Streptomyces sp. CC77]